MSFASHRRKTVKQKRSRASRLAKARVKQVKENGENGYGLYGPGPCSKLNIRVARGICEHLARGNTLALSSRMNCVAPNTMWQWIRAGEMEPDGPFGQFARDVAYAQDLAHRAMVKKLLEHDDWRATSFIMKNRWPKEYRDHIVQEMTGPDGGPVAMMQHFNVVLELHQKDEPNESGQHEPNFRIDGASGALPDLEEHGSEESG